MKYFEKRSESFATLCEAAADVVSFSAIALREALVAVHHEAEDAEEAKATLSEILSRLRTSLNDRFGLPQKDEDGKVNDPPRWGSIKSIWSMARGIALSERMNEDEYLKTAYAVAGLKRHGAGVRYVEPEMNGFKRLYDTRNGETEPEPENKGADGRRNPETAEPEGGDTPEVSEDGDAFLAALVKGAKADTISTKRLRSIATEAFRAIITRGEIETAEETAAEIAGFVTEAKEAAANK